MPTPAPLPHLSRTDARSVCNVLVRLLADTLARVAEYDCATATVLAGEVRRQFAEHEYALAKQHGGGLPQMVKVRLSQAQEADIRDDYQDGTVSQAELARRYHCSQALISKIIRGTRTL
jgi:Mor family transcriptional regulator